MILVQMNFDYPVEKMGDVLTQEGKALAESINKEKGFISKIWIENKETAESGGIYIFEDMESVKAYVEMHAKRIGSIGAGELKAKYFHINEPLSKLNKGI